MGKTSQFTFVDLFSGIGGFHSAFTQLGGECLAFSEVNKDAIHSYCENYDISEAKNLGDIRKIKELPKHDILTGGVPCQSWSIAGKNLGFEDDRGQLWNDTIFLLKQAQPKAFIFENVKGLADPRNAKSLKYIKERIKSAGYFADHFVLSSYDFGALQDRIRVYIVGFKKRKHLEQFRLASPKPNKHQLFEFLDDIEIPVKQNKKQAPKDLFDNLLSINQTRLQKTDGLNHFFVFSDIRNGHTTIHSWDILDTTEREKFICMLLLKNRRKKLYGALDGNPLAYLHFKNLDPTIREEELRTLVKKGILKEVDYVFEVNRNSSVELSQNQQIIITLADKERLQLDNLKQARELKINKINIKTELSTLVEIGVIHCIEKRYEFKFTKISSGIFGVNRVYLPTSDIYPTLVASDTSDFVATKNIEFDTPENYKQRFLEQIYHTNSYRKITKEEACRLQGFSADFKLPVSRNRWMKLIGNSVSVPVIHSLAKSIIQAGTFSSPQFQSQPQTEQYV